MRPPVESYVRATVTVGSIETITGIEMRYAGEYLDLLAASTSDPAEATCVDCLETAAEYGGACRRVLFQMDQTPRSGRPGSIGGPYFTWSSSREQSWPKDGDE